MTGIYKITSPSGKIYVGQSVDIFGRINRYELLNCKLQVKLYNSLMKYDFNNHKFEIIELCGESDLNYWERYYQELYDVIGKNGLNLKITPINGKSGKLSEETKQKISVSNIGKKVSNETRLKMSIVNTGKKLSKETKLKISESSKGKILSEETKLKMIESRNCIKIINLDLNIIYNSVLEASKTLNITTDTIYYRIKTKSNKLIPKLDYYDPTRDYTN